ncbi:MAG: aspartate kinase [Bacteroidota bacterium]|jgi:aspartate kinase|nr:aspartate kinase [Bacteroidota bacterium]
MKIFKFGGASVKDAEAVKNVANILKYFPGENIIVVVSAMGKVTNALERLTDAFYYKKENAEEVLNEIRKYHQQILDQLFPDRNHPVHVEISNTFVELDWAIEEDPSPDYNYDYDKIVSMGEIISTKIVSAYLNEAGVDNKWWDVRGLIQTDNAYREGNVDWALTQYLVDRHLNSYFANNKGIVVTQGFLGGTSENFTTTLGREGSDYTAAILAYTTNAESVTIWKDVPGVLNADPKWFDETQKLEQISYQDAIELAYYGATVIHPKTIKPLQNKKIPLLVKSFLHPEEKGTIINDVQSPLPVPSFIFKINQVLLSISPKDFSFIMEHNLSEMFNLFAERQVKVNVMQNSAISFSVSIDNDERKLPELIKTLQKDYKVLYNEGLELITIRYYDQATIDRVTVGKVILLEVKSRYTVQLVVKNA